MDKGCVSAAPSSPVNGFFLYLQSQAVLTTALAGVSEMTCTDDTVLLPEKADGASPGPGLPMLSRVASPSLETGASHLSL